MDLLEVTGTDFGEKINVDRTLISKWKNNARPLKSTSSHFDAVIQALIHFNRTRNDTILERFFIEVYPNIDRNEPDYLKTCLNIWLIGQDLGSFNSFNNWRQSKDALYTTNIEIFQGNHGKRKALLEFFDYALSLPPGQEIFISDLENASWLKEDPKFYQIYYKKIDDMAHYGHNVIIIYHLENHKRLISKFDSYRLSKYFTGHVTAYHSHEKNHPGPSLYIIHKHMLILSIGNPKQNDERYIALYRDPFSISQMVKMFIERLNRSSKLMSTYSSHGTNLRGFTDHIVRAIEKGNCAYYVTAYPPFSTIPDHLMKHILAHQDLTDQENFELMQMFKLNTQLLHNHMDNTIILSREKLTEALKEDEFRLDDISSTLKKDVFISKTLVKKHLDTLSEDKSNTILVSDFDNVSLLSKSMLWLVKDQLMYSFPFDGHTNFATSDSIYLLSQAAEIIESLFIHAKNTVSLKSFLKTIK